MKVRADYRKFHAVEADALVVPVFENEVTENPLLRELDQITGGVISSAASNEELRGKHGEVVYVHATGSLKAKRLLLVGAGKRAEATAETVRRIAGTAVRFLRDKNAKSMALVRGTTVDLRQAARAAVEGAILGTFEPDFYKTDEKENRQVEEMMLVPMGDFSPEHERGIEEGRILAESTNFTRTLVNEPGSSMTPRILAERAASVASEFGLKIDVLDEKKMEELGMGALLGVARGSAEPPRMIVLTHEPANEGEGAGKETLALVGKGITFDSGGISIKPADGMEKMKYDMAGGAAVIGAMRAIAQLKPDSKIVGVIPATENMPGGRAQKPGDVVRAMTGKTIEVINTDAEGRLILADAVAYARQLGATRIVDMATLTGACLVALGNVHAAVLGTNQDLIEQIISSGKRAGERFWQLPLDQEYREQIKSMIADIKNTGGRNAGTITAAYFIREFAGDVPWAHLDIAGTAWMEEAKPHMSKGPTGVPVRTLVYLACGDSL